MPCHVVRRPVSSATVRMLAMSPGFIICPPAIVDVANSVDIFYLSFLDARASPDVQTVECGNDPCANIMSEFSRAYSWIRSQY